MNFSPEAEEVTIIIMVVVDSKGKILWMYNINGRYQLHKFNTEGMVIIIIKRCLPMVETIGKNGMN